MIQATIFEAETRLSSRYPHLDPGPFRSPIAPPKVRRIIADKNNKILVSAATAWEIATKVRLGKLSGAERLEKEYFDALGVRRVW